jgi:hypothetical protein
MPIGRLQAAALVLGRALECPPRAIGALLVRRRILVGEHMFGGEIDERRVAGIAQKQRLLSVADEDECVMRDRESVHAGLRVRSKFCARAVLIGAA